MVSCGNGPGGLPYHRFGSDGPRLFVIPGVMDALAWNEPSRLTARLLAHYYFRHLRSYDVWVLSRCPGLPDQSTPPELARQYVTALEKLGASHVLGISLGGAIATYLTATRPELVEKLVLVSCGSRLSETGRQHVEQWHDLALNREYEKLHRTYAQAVYSGWRARFVSLQYRLIGPLLPTPANSGDAARACRALLAYDSRNLDDEIGAQTRIDVPTLLVSGQADELFSAETRQEYLSGLEWGKLVLLQGGGAIYDEKPRQVAQAIRSFLDEPEYAGRRNE